MTQVNFNKTMSCCKVDPDKRLVFGWFSVVEEDGQMVVDKQGDVIEEGELETAAYRFVLEARDAGEMHKRTVGRLVESVVFTKEKQELLGIDLGKVGWFGGFFVDDDEAWKRIKEGHLPAFSIGGTGRRDSA